MGQVNGVLVVLGLSFLVGLFGLIGLQYKNGGGPDVAGIPMALAEWRLSWQAGGSNATGARG